ncbi:hypothetical protein DH2020_023462 [Rehmannia glutinosa]|uniref:Uncharacterized protein n=1 Tax=Rehmannia glutinosa TaxID=99300 RepID=A0ABR0W9X6_REHGL
MSAEFSFTGNSRPSFLLQFKPRSGDFSVRRFVESPLISLSSQNYKSLLIQNDVVPAEKLSWNQLFSSAYGVLTDGEVCARTSVTVSRAVVKLGWSMRFPPAGDSKGGYGAEILLKDLPYLVLRKIAIEHVAGDTSGKAKKRRSHGKKGNVAEARAYLKRELDLLKSDNLKLEMDYSGRNMEVEAPRARGGKQQENN